MKTRNHSISLPRCAVRNPLVAAAHARHAGSHRPTGGAQRQQARRELRHLLHSDSLSPATRPPHCP